MNADARPGPLPVGPASTPLAVAAHLREAILSGRLAPGQRLVEAELTQRLGTSRGPLREAFRQLAAEGLVTLVPNRGALVRRMTRTETLELFEIRAELEALAGRRAAARMRDAGARDCFAAETAAIRDDRPRHSTAEYIGENDAFHAAILRASGNGQLAQIGHALQLGLIMAQVAPSLPSEVIAASLTEHRRIADAILAADETAADAEIRAHLARARDFMAALPEGVFG